jgi:hypothetical protein
MTSATSTSITLRHRPHRLADHVTVLLAQHLPDDLLDRHPLGTVHPLSPPFIDSVERADDLSATVAGTTSTTPFRPNPTYTTLRDVTAQAVAEQHTILRHATRCRFTWR